MFSVTAVYKNVADLLVISKYVADRFMFSVMVTWLYQGMLQIDSCSQ